MEDSAIVSRIQALCKARNWTTYRLAKQSGITYSTLCTMLRKSTAPSISTLEKICHGFGISLAEFFNVDNPRAMLTPEQKAFLQLWDALDDRNRQAAESYIRYLLSKQA